VTAGGTYLNPVYPRSFPDPFVLKFRGEYWGYCTGFWNDGRVFGILHSRDLVEWQERPGAMEPLPGGHTCYWAPEVTYDNGRFYLYYSVGNEERMEIRVAMADSPEGPFVDSGRRLTSEDFAIDAHVFLDKDGTRWLFYATDFLTHSHIGTGTVRDRMRDPFTLAGDPRPVTLPRYDWHVYHPNRPEKGGVRWHTVEGPFVLEHEGIYYQMFSGGNWQNPTYGVSYATSEEGPQSLTEWAQEELPILRTTGEVVGPGHNSVVRGPDNRQLWCVYHRWSPDTSARVLAIDPLGWEGKRMRVAGPSTAPQPAPRLPTVSAFLDEPLVLAEGGEHSLETGASSFLLEVSARALGNSGSYGIALRNGEEELLRIVVEGRAIRLFRVEVDGPLVTVSLDGLVHSRKRLAGTVSSVALVAPGTSAEFSGLALTVERP
jgi:GH43 family beta-xylosidase